MTSDEYKAYLDALRPGDKVKWLCNARLGSAQHVVETEVIRRTAAQIVCKEGYGEIRYRAEDGRKVGGRYSRFPEPADGDEVAAVLAENARMSGARTLAAHKWLNEPAEVIAAALNLIK